MWRVESGTVAHADLIVDDSSGYRDVIAEVHLPGVAEQIVADHQAAASATAGEAQAEEIRALRKALEKSIRSHENLLEFRIIPDRYRDECHEILESLRAALHPPQEAASDGR